MRRIGPSILKASLALTFLFNASQPALGGWLLSPALGWGAFSFRPEQEEQTPNYYGIGPEATLGFSIHQAFDIAAVLSYHPGSLGAAKIGREKASLFCTGGHLAVRLKDQAFLGLRLLKADYQLFKPDGSQVQVPGKWEGPGGSLLLGSIHKIDKRQYWQLSLEVFSLVIKPLPGQSLQPQQKGWRKLDGFRINMAYTFNGFENTLIQNSLFKNVF